MTREQVAYYIMRVLDNQPRQFRGLRAWQAKGGPSHKWWTGFLSRHRNIRQRKSDRLCHARRKVTKQQLDSFFSALSGALAELLASLGPGPAPVRGPGPAPVHGPGPAPQAAAAGAPDGDAAPGMAPDPHADDFD